MDQSSFPKQTRADQDSRSDVDQDFPVDQTRKNDVRRRRRRTFKTKQNVARSRGVGDSSNIVNAEMFPQNFGTPSSSFPKQSRADQDSRSDVDQDLPVDQTRKEDDASPVKPKQPSLPKLGERPCAPPPEKPKEPSLSKSDFSYESIDEDEWIRGLRRERVLAISSCSRGSSPDAIQGQGAFKSRPFSPKFSGDEDSFINEWIRGTTFQLRGGDGGCSGSTVAIQGQGAGACGYGPLAIGFNHGHLASVAPSVYKNGAACGACFQIRCKNLALCSSKGARVTVTGSNSNNRTGFVLSRRAFKALAKQGSETEIFRHRILDLEYKWVPCAYKSQNLTLRVEESSQYPNYLAVQILNQGGQTEIGAIDVLGGNNVGSGFMSRKHGAVWETKLDRAGPLVFRFIVRDTFSTQRILTEQPIPADWKPGMSYDTGVQFTAIAREICDVCDNGKWREM